MKHTYQLRGIASTLRMRTTISNLQVPHVTSRRVRHATLKSGDNRLLNEAFFLRVKTYFSHSASSSLSFICPLLAFVLDLGYSFEHRPNSHALGTAGSVKTIGLSINVCSHSDKTSLTIENRIDWSRSSGFGDLKDLTGRATFSFPGGWGVTQGKFWERYVAEARKPRPCLRQKLIISLPFS